MKTCRSVCGEIRLPQSFSVLGPLPFGFFFICMPLGPFYGPKSRLFLGAEPLLQVDAAVPFLVSPLKALNRIRRTSNDISAHCSVALYFQGFLALLRASTRFGVSPFSRLLREIKPCPNLFSHRTDFLLSSSQLSCDSNCLFCS